MTRLVYRLEAQDGVGPYQYEGRDGLARFDVSFQWLAREMSRAHCSGYHDRVYDAWEILWLELDESRHEFYLFGCTTLRYLERWFGAFLYRLATLPKAAFSVVTYRVQKPFVLARGGHAAFHCEFAERVSNVPLKDYLEAR